MTKPLQTMFDLTQAYLRLGLRIADACRENGYKLMEIAERGALEVKAEAQLALTPPSADRTEVPAFRAIAGHLHDFVAELEAVRMSTRMQIEEAVGEWRNQWAAALGPEPGLPFTGKRMP